MHSIDWTHGLGDSANFAQLLPLWIERGHQIGVRCSPDKAPLFVSAGAQIVAKADVNHFWLHPHEPGPPQHHDDWSGNKNAWNLSCAEMPDIGTYQNLWPELAARKDRFLGSTAADAAKIRGLVAGLPRPLILLHTQGNTCCEWKNLPPHTVSELYERLIAATAGTLILLDWDSRVPRLPHYNVRHLSEWGGLSLGELWALYQESQLLIGIDSGPLHFARLSDVPILGVWTRFHPAHFALPPNRPDIVHLVSSHPPLPPWNRHRRARWHIVEAGRVVTAAEIADCATRLVGLHAWYSLVDHPARDLQLRGFLRGCYGTHGRYSDFVDRHRTFQAALEGLHYPTSPVIVETGTIRAEEDWGGAGFSTYLWGCYLAGRGHGECHSVDLSPDNCRFARTWCQNWPAVVVHESDSLAWLQQWQRPIDLLYLDSLDTEDPRHAEHCRSELEIAEPLLTPGAQVLIDDTVWHGKWVGKGALAVPYLLRNGWHVHLAGYQVLLRRA